MRGQFTAVIFDLDGTLVDSYEPIAASLNSVREHFGLEAKSLDTVRREVGHGLEALIADNVGRDRVEEGVRIFRARYRRVFLAGTRLLDGVSTTLSALREAGVPMAVTSNKPAYFTREIVEALGLASCFRAIVGPEMVVRPKPDPEMVLMAVEALGRPKEEVLYVGDMTIDIDTCRRAGIAVCIVPLGSDPRDRLVAAQPDFLVDRFEEIRRLVAPGASS